MGSRHIIYILEFKNITYIFITIKKQILNNMTTKETLSKYGLPNDLLPYVNSINYGLLDSFVSEITHAMVVKFGVSRMRNEIDVDDASSPVSELLTHIIEVGCLKVLADNNLETTNESNLAKGIAIACLALNFSLAKELKNKLVYSSSSFNYYNLEALQIIMSRVLNLAMRGQLENPGRFRMYADSMVQTNLKYKL